MEAKVEQISTRNACCTCGNAEMVHARNIVDSYIKSKGSFVPLSGILESLLEFDVSRNNLKFVIEY